MKDLMRDHFDKVVEVGVLVFIFVFATLMLAFYGKGNDEMARWIENGAIITILARSFGSRQPPANTTTSVTTATIPPAPPPIVDQSMLPIDQQEKP
jgi:hypothetical protein